MEAFGSNDELVQKEQREKETRHNFATGVVHFKIVWPAANHGTEALHLLCRAKELFQIQLPKMPREYILKQVFDRKHKTLCMFHGDEMIGAVCFRAFFERRFCEVVFLAVDFHSQIRGNGSFVMCLFKEYFKAEIARYASGIQGSDEVVLLDHEMMRYTKLAFTVYLMTYADNSAIGFFKKQGFTTSITFAEWVGCIKDYEGGTLMECTVYWEIDYINATETIDRMRDTILNEICGEPRYGPVSSDTLWPLTEISGIREKIGVASNPKPQAKVLEDFLEFLLADLLSNAASWPFLRPVNPKEVPDYYQVIKKPMDLSEMQGRLLNKKYGSHEEFETDFLLMIRNCCYYNGSTTQYYKCAQNLETHYQKRIEQYKNKLFLARSSDRAVET